MTQITNLASFACFSWFYSEDFRLAADNVRCFAFLSVRRFCPCFLQTDVHGGVDDRAALDLGAREEHELTFVKDALGLDFGHVGHRA
jgi:hypothetical protein